MKNIIYLLILISFSCAKHNMTGAYSHPPVIHEPDFSIQNDPLFGSSGMLKNGVPYYPISKIEWQGSGSYTPDPQLPSVDSLRKAWIESQRSRGANYILQSHRYTTDFKYKYPMNMYDYLDYKEFIDSMNTKFDWDKPVKNQLSLYNSDGTMYFVERDTFVPKTDTIPLITPDTFEYRTIFKFPKRDWERDDNWERIRDVVDTTYQCPTVYFQDSMFSTVDHDTTHCPGKAVMVRYQNAWIDSVYAKAVVWMFEHGGYTQVENMKIIVRVKQSQTYINNWNRPREPIFGLIHYRIHEELEEVVHLIGDKAVKVAYIDKILETYKAEK